MKNKTFGYVIFASFIVGTVFLVVIGHNFGHNMKAMRRDNLSLLAELQESNHLRQIDRDILGVEGRIRAAIATNDTSHLAGIDEKIKSVKIYLDSLNGNPSDEKTKKYLKRLGIITDEKIAIKNKLLKRYQETGNMDDTSVIANPGARKISNEITVATDEIYNSRQRVITALSNAVIENSVQARIYSNLLMVFMFFSGGVLCWFLFNQFKKQSRLILKLDTSEKTAREALLIKENFLALALNMNTSFFS